MVAGTLIGRARPFTTDPDVPQVGRMTVTAEVRIEHAKLPLSRTLAELAGVRVEREYQMGGADDRYGFYSVTGDGPDRFESALDADPTVAEWLLVSEFEERLLYRIELTDEAMVLSSTLAAMGIAIVQATGIEGSWRFVLQLPAREQFAAFNAYCDDAGIDLSVERLSRTTAELDAPATPPLTDAQREALVTAYEHGYFDEPRQTSLEQLASELDVSSTAVGGRIRRGTANLVDAVLRTENRDTSE